MKKKKKTKIIIVLFLVLFLFIGITYAYAANQQNTATNVVTVGKVSIELINDDIPSGSAISAGQPVPKTVEVENKGYYPAFVRLKLKMNWTGSENIDYTKLTADAIIPNCQSDWVRGEGEDPEYAYYYYQHSLAAGDKVTFMDDYQISEEKILEVLKDYHGDRFSVDGKITVQAEAVQSDYFVEPLKINGNGEIINWEGISFVGFQEDDATPIPAVSGGAVSGSAVSGAAVDFVGSAGNFVSFKDGDDLFLNMKGMMPGQTVDQQVTITNVMSNDTIRVYLYAQFPESSNTEEDKALLENLHVIVTEEKKRRILYEGNLLNQPSEGRIPLGEYAPGDVANLNISLMLDPKWNIGARQTKIQWVFTTESEANPTAQPVVTAIPDNPSPVTNKPEIPKVTQEPEPTKAVVTTPPKPTNTPEAVEPSDPPVVTEPATREPEKTPKPTETPMVTKQPQTPEPTQEPVPTPDPGIVILASENPVVTEEPPDESTPAPTDYKESQVKRETVPKPKIKEVRATKTGDATPIVFWMVLCVGSFLGMIGMGSSLLRTKKK